MSNTVKICLLGDLTCDKPMLKALQKHNYDFSKSFENVKKVWANDDLVISNLETVFAGEKEGYNPRPYCYNSPDTMADAIKDAGINFLTTANNHSLDCYLAGVKRTIAILDDRGIDHTGTFVDSDTPLDKRFCVKEINGIRIAVAAFTYSMNLTGIRSDPSGRICGNINLLDNVTASSEKHTFLYNLIPLRTRNRFFAWGKKIQGLPTVDRYSDNYSIRAREEQKIAEAIDILNAARSESDFVICCVHCGGQFNMTPGLHSQLLLERLAPYADVIAANHAHVTQPIVEYNNKIIAYSLGGMNMSPSATYISKAVPFEYSAALRLTVEKNDDKVVVANKSVSFIIAKEDEDQYVSMYPAEPDYISDYMRYNAVCNNIRI